MQFRVGPHVYRLKIPNQPLYTDAGDEADGMTLESQRLIVMSPDVPAEQREEVLYHELQHAWLNHVPTPSDEEQQCNLFATILLQLRQDLENQGGVAALQAYPCENVALDSPPRSLATAASRIDAMTAAAPQSAALRAGAPRSVAFANDRPLGPPDRIVCGGCGVDVMCGDIACGHPTYHASTQRWQVERWMHCETCGAVQLWTEVCTPDGVPLGQYVAHPQPRLLRGPAAQGWLANRAK